MAEIQWIKITTFMFDDEKIKLIESMPEGSNLLLIWIKLLTLAGRCNVTGFIFLSENIPYTEEMLSTVFNAPLNIVRLALATFENFRMIERGENHIIKIVNWEKYQNIEGMNLVREQARIRVERFRKKQKLLEVGNVTVTQRNAPDKNRKEKNIYTTEFESWYSSYPNPEDKGRSFSNWKTCLKEFTVEQLTTAKNNYTEATKDREQKFIKTSANFLGRDKFFKEYIETPKESQPAQNNNKELTEYLKYARGEKDND